MKGKSLMKEIVVELLSNSIESLSCEEIENLLEIPPKKDMGDYAFPCFKLASVYKKSPAIIAKEIEESIKDRQNMERIEAVGPYINFYVDKVMFISKVLDKYINNKDIKVNIGDGKNIVIDYSSPNIAKKFHIGHLRTTIIGNSLYKMFNFLGYNSIGINHLGDWGTQFGKLIVAYKKWGSKEAIEENGIDELGKIYVKFHDEAEIDDSLNDEARAWFTKMENGNEEALELWKWFKEISLKEFEKIYDLLDISFDSYAGESFYNDKMDAVVSGLEEKGITKLSEGARIVDLEEYNMPPCLITKKDGSTLYATRDITAGIYRKNEYDFHKCLYVTGLEQKLHFSQWFKVIELLGYKWSKDLVHVPYGMVSMATGKLSTRKGNIILVEDLLNEAIQKTKDIIEEKNPNLKEKEKVAKQVGIGAIIFNDLYNSRIKDVTFSWDKVLNFQGETGPYVQYTHARICSILNRVDNKIDISKIDYSLLAEESAYYLVKEIDRFITAVREATDKLEPYIVARYAVSLSQKFSKFYDECQIIVDNEEIRNTRLILIDIVKNILSTSLGLLGINSPEQM